MRLRAALTVALALGLPARAPAEEAGAFSDWTMSMTGRGLGRGVAVDGSDRKFLEDYDTLDSGGGAETRFEGRDDQGNYFEGAASILGLDDGRGVDDAGVHVRGGRRGVYTLVGDFTRSRSFFDDRLRHGGGGTVVPARLGRDLDLVRTNGRLAADLRLGRRSRLGLTYRHWASDGEQSRIKGSTVESLSSFAFRFPAFSDVDTRNDSIDVEAQFPAGPLDVRLTGGWSDISSRNTIYETDFRPDLVREVVRFEDDIDTTIARAGIDVATPPEWPVAGYAGYRFLWVDADGDARQDSDSVLVRSADGISVTERSHAGHTGMTFFAAPRLLVRTSYSIVDQHRDGDGTERRGGGSRSVRSDTDKSVMRHRPRLEISYTGLPRTRLRAAYRYEHSDRDLDVQMLGATADPGLGIDRVQVTDQDRDVHRLLLEARIRADRALLVKAGYRYRREDLDEDTDDLLNEYVLGDRHRETHTGFLGGRYRWSRTTTIEARGEFQHEDYERTDTPGDSSVSMDAQIGLVRAVSAPAPGLLLTSVLSIANRDYDLAEPRRDLGVFAPIEFRGRSLSSAFAGRYRLNDRTTLGGRYTVIDAGGSLDNIIHRLFLDAGYRVSEHLRLTGGYAFLSFDEGRYDGPDYDAHLGWLAVQLDFATG